MDWAEFGLKKWKNKKIEKLWLVLTVKFAL